MSDYEAIGAGVGEALAEQVRPLLVDIRDVLGQGIRPELQRIADALTVVALATLQAQASPASDACLRRLWEAAPDLPAAPATPEPSHGGSE